MKSQRALIEEGGGGGGGGGGIAVTGPLLPTLSGRTAV
jgi:hypothetical protein